MYHVGHQTSYLSWFLLIFYRWLQKHIRNNRAWCWSPFMAIHPLQSLSHNIKFLHLKRNIDNVWTSYFRFFWEFTGIIPKSNKDENSNVFLSFWWFISHWILCFTLIGCPQNSILLTQSISQSDALVLILWKLF